MTIEEDMRTLAERAKAAAYELAALPAAVRTRALGAIADAIATARAEILSANAEDCLRASDAAVPMLDRLRLDPSRLDGIVSAVRSVAALPDPLGTVLDDRTRPNGLRIIKQRVPIGVVAIIYESRPNVTVDSAVLCLRAGNAVILRGGSDAMRSNAAFAAAIRSGLLAAGAPVDAVQLVMRPEHEAVNALVKLDKYIDVVIPRGGEGLIRNVVESARVPVIKHYKGVCHVYVDSEANLEMALRIVVNAKCQRPGVCNAAETLLVSRLVAERFLPGAEAALLERGVELRADESARALMPSAKPAVEDDWSAEYLALILSVKIVDDLPAAIEHINSYGSHHSDTIVTNSSHNADEFMARVDSAAVYVNASTRFTDGAEFGLGAEIGISTDKLHARGPMGVDELTTYKYLIYGEGQVRE